MVDSVLVVTIVHHPSDARIYHRQIGALLQAGWHVTYAAPFSGYGLDPAGQHRDGLRTVDLARAHGRHRLAAIAGARRVIHRLGPEHDVILLHDPELLLAGTGRGLPPLVWDVHEDTAAALQVRAWVPRLLRRPLGMAVRCVERLAEQRLQLFLADYDYSERFRRPHLVVPNATDVPTQLADGPVLTDGRHRVVYLGSITMERGAAEMVSVARRLPPGIRLQLIGPAHGRAEELVRGAADEGVLDWFGFVPSDQATASLRGALAGLCLLHDEANFRPSMATKVVEYLAQGVPAVVTPLPAQRVLVERTGGGAVVPFGAVDEVVAIVREWSADPGRVQAMGRAGHAEVLEHHDWRTKRVAFVEGLRAASRRERPAA